MQRQILRFWLRQNDGLWGSEILAFNYPQGRMTVFGDKRFWAAPE
jgi:hypothetical protein